MNLPDNCYVYRPEHTKPVVVDICDECSNYIYEGDEYYDIKGTSYCKECIENHKKEAESKEW